MATPEQEIIWLAGLLEGEGCFYMDKQLSRSGSGEYTRTPKISVGMVDEDVIVHVARLFGTKVYAAKPYREGKRMYTATTSGVKAAWLMRAILPWMGARRSEKISEVLKAYQDYVKNYPGAYKKKKVRPWSIDDSGEMVFVGSSRRGCAAPVLEAQHSWKTFPGQSFSKVGEHERSGLR